jgi:aspartyl-tRNA(Asn)/glutamyl-tRNA(Gln) amidotransferase subunit A
MTIAKAQEALRQGKLRPSDLAEAFLSEAKKQNPEINAYLEFFDDTISEDVARAEKLLQDGKATPLTGVPIAIKDNMLVRGKVSTSGSKVLTGHKAVYDSTVVRKLKDAGAIILGRTNMDEFAMGSSNETSAYGPVKNPLDPTRVPGGSSGGSAAAVAMGGALASLGSDTGGSIRQPAALCGLVGMKPTYGAVSRYGLMSLASSLDQIGPFAKTVEDAEAVYSVIRGYDPKDSTSLPDARFPTEQKHRLTIGVPRAFVEMKGIDEDVRKRFDEAMKTYEKAGHKVVNIELPLVKYALPTYYIIMPAEASSNLARYDGIRYGYSVESDNLIEVYCRSRGEGFGREVRRRILLGTYVLSAGYYDAYYNKAIALRRKISEDFDRVFRDVDAVATPTSPSPAFKFGEKSGDPVAMYLEDIFTVTANIAGIPGISVPSGTVMRDRVELPVGLQLMSARTREDLLFQAAKVYESHRS